MKVIERRALESASLPVFTLLESGETEAARLTCGEMLQRARSLGALLQSQQAEGERALLLYPAGLDFVTAFFGCLHAGVVAVPVPPEPGRRRGTLSRLEAVARDAQPRVALTTTAILAEVQGILEQAPTLARIRWIATDDVPDLSDLWQPVRTDPDALAYLQYTSGSTSTPKGVMVSHANVLHNSEHIRQAWGYTPESVALMWVPNFHDDGLVHGIVQPLYTGFRSYLMPPAAFVQRPVRWLRAISRLRATHSGGPNFAYALCSRKIALEQRADLDLRSWRMAYNAAEPVRRDTLERFVEDFGPCGFRPEAFYPSFGLAEATLLVTTGGEGLPLQKTVRSDGLEQGRVVAAAPGERGARTVMGCGRPVRGTRLMIVHPETRQERGPGEVGEIWVSDPSVAQGYWRRPDATEETFGARLAGSGEGPFLRTGDLGFLEDGELYVTGRLKDLIILRGRNIYPQDVELVVERSHPGLRPGCGAAFSVEAGGEERLAVVQEVDGRTPVDVDVVVDAASRVLAEQYDVQFYRLVLVEPGSIPKTSSGKIQRHACRAELLAGGLAVVASWTLPLGGGGAAAQTAAPVPATAADPLEATQRELRSRVGGLLGWLRDYAGKRINSRLIDERRSIPPYVVSDFAGQGLFGLQVPEGQGGLGLTTREMMRVLEQLGAIDLTLATFVTGHNALGLRPLQRFAAPAAREELVPELARGRQLAAFALTEPGAGSNPRALAASAAPDGAGGWRLHGTKWWSGSASWAGVVNVFARATDPEGRALGITGFVVRQGAPGLRLGTEAMTLGLRGMSQCAVHLEDVPAGAADLLGEPGAGMAVAEDAMSFTRLCLATVSVGGMKRCAQLMLRYASRRQIATGLLLDNPVTLARLGELTAAITALESLVAAVAGALDEGRPAPAELLIACKTAGPELLWRAADDLVQLLGGRGYLESNVAPQILRDARVFRIFEGPTETLRMHLGSSLEHGAAALYAFLSDSLGAQAVADRLREVRAAIASRSPFADRPSALRWGHVLIGEAATFALLQAAAGWAGQTRAAEWARLRFEEVAARALSGSPAEAALLDARSTAELIQGFSSTVGDVEQTLAGEDHALDELLRPAHGTTAAAPVPAVPIQAVPAPGPRGAETGTGSAAVRDWLTGWLVREVGLEASAIDVRRPFAALGLDSITGVRLADDLEEWLGRPLAATLVWEHPTIEALARHLSGEDAAAAVPVPVSRDEDRDLERILRELEGLSEEEARQTLLSSGGPHV